MPKCLQIMCAKYYEIGACFIKKKPYSSKLVRLLDTASKFALFSVSGLKDEKLIKKSKPTQKLKHANSIPESFEYFCQISSKSIVIILSYTVSKLARFLRHSVYLASVCFRSV